MNHYFTPHTPKPRLGAGKILLRSMLCALVVLVVGTGVWLGLGVIYTETVLDGLVEDGSSTNNVIGHVSDTSR